jgi:tRNA dimethylallyltransferase
MNQMNSDNNTSIKMLNKINIIFGTTASGKTKYAVRLAKKLNGVIINSDAMQVYGEIPILTAQPTEEEKEGIIHKLYGYVSCLEEYSVVIWLRDTVPKIKRILQENKTPVLVGGSGLYIKCLTEGILQIPAIPLQTKNLVRSKYTEFTNETLHKKLYDADLILAARYKTNDRQRILRALEVFECTGICLSKWQETKPIPYFPEDMFHLIFVNRDREEIYRRINNRFDEMINNGAIEEVRKIYNSISDNASLSYTELPPAHGIKEIISFLRGDITLPEAVNKSKLITRNYAKRQLTWARNQIKFNVVYEIIENST